MALINWCSDSVSDLAITAFPEGGACICSLYTALKLLQHFLRQIVRGILPWLFANKFRTKNMDVDDCRFVFAANLTGLAIDRHLRGRICAALSKALLHDSRRCAANTPATIGCLVRQDA